MDPSVIAGTVGAAFGGISLIVAILAKRDSKASLDIAKRGDEKSAKANELSSESNRIAVEARDFAEDANTIARRSEAREKEINRVTWETRWENPGECRIFNIGQDEALRVSISLSVDGEQVHRSADRIAPGECTNLPFPEFGEHVANEQAAYQARERSRRRRISDQYFPMPDIPETPLLINAPVIGHVTWVTALEKACRHEIQDNVCFSNEP